MEALGLQDTASGLVTSVQGVTTALTSKKADLDQLGVTSIAVQTLKDQQASSKALSDAIVSKLFETSPSAEAFKIDQIRLSG
ncbi:hypothetical protein BN1723_017403, partial [Verticillium longisporum]